MSPVCVSCVDKSFMMDNAVKLLPLPDSPTIQVVRPGYKSNEISPTKILRGSLMGDTFKCLTSSIFFKENRFIHNNSEEYEKSIVLKNREYLAESMK